MIPPSDDNRSFSGLPAETGGGFDFGANCRIDLPMIRAAHQRIGPHIHRTPVFTSQTLNELTGARLWFKGENLQKAGAFKSRGACNAVFSLPEETAGRGVVTHSSGNHAAALARAASRRGIPAFIVMPSNAPPVKIAAVRHYGGHITFCEPTLPAREATADRLLQETGGTLIHPYNEERIIAGQATAAVEFLEEVPDLDILLAPVGGGGLLSGTALAGKYLRENLAVVGAEPQEADDAFRSLSAGRLIPLDSTTTIADGLCTSLGDKTFAILRHLVDRIDLASEAGIVQATELILTRLKLVVEPSAAVPLAAVLENRPAYAGRKVGIILSGGNLDGSAWFRLRERILGRDRTQREAGPEGR